MRKKEIRGKMTSSLFVKAKTPLSLWNKDKWQSHLALSSSFVPQPPWRNRLPLVLFEFYSQLDDLFKTPELPQCHKSCFLFFAVEMFHYNTNIVFNNTHCAQVQHWVFYIYILDAKNKQKRIKLQNSFELKMSVSGSKRKSFLIWRDTYLLSWWHWNEEKIGTFPIFAN